MHGGAGGFDFFVCDKKEKIKLINKTDMVVKE
jgi:hypothetical protein